ncbi:MAG: hypothetical protein AAF602_00285, partial [Myxococcota bacterium]
EAIPAEIALAQDCDYVDYGYPEVAYGLSVSSGFLTISITDYVIECVVDYEAFVREQDGVVDVLFQREDLTPTAIADCNCYADFEIRIPASSSPSQVDVYERRGFGINLREPTRVASLQP